MVVTVVKVVMVEQDAPTAALGHGGFCFFFVIVEQGDGSGAF